MSFDPSKAGTLWLSEEMQEHVQEYKRTASGILVPSHLSTRKYPIGFDFFAGAGGFSLGFIQAGFQMLGACEWAPDAAQTYLVNLAEHPVQMYYTSDLHREHFTQYFQKQFKKWEKNTKDNPTAKWSVSGSGWIQSAREAGRTYPGVPYFFAGDICDLEGAEVCRSMGIEVGDLDVIIGGPPCQGFSTSGKQKIDDPRNLLIFQYARMICEMKPKTFVMEEVPEILKMRTAQGVPVIDQFLRIIEDGNFMSYEAGMKALNIRQEDIGLKPKYILRPAKNAHIEPRKQVPTPQNIKTRKEQSQLSIF